MGCSSSTAAGAGTAPTTAEFVPFYSTFEKAKQLEARNAAEAEDMYRKVNTSAGEGREGVHHARILLSQDDFRYCVSSCTALLLCCGGHAGRVCSILQASSKPCHMKI